MTPSSHSSAASVYGDEDAGLDQQLLFPFLCSRTSPREDNLALFPFCGAFERYGINETTWVSPLFDHTHSLAGWSTDLYPIAFFGRDRAESHTVNAPLFFDFTGPSSRSTVAFPSCWRFAEEDSLTRLVGTFLYTERPVGKGVAWSVRVLPLFGYGERPDGDWWSVLVGLAGYEWRGRDTEAKVFWNPVPLSGDRQD